MTLGLDIAVTDRDREAFGRHPACLQRVVGIHVHWFGFGAAEAVGRVFDVIGASTADAEAAVSKTRIATSARSMSAAGDLVVPDLGPREGHEHVINVEARAVDLAMEPELELTFGDLGGIDRRLAHAWQVQVREHSLDQSARVLVAEAPSSSPHPE